MRVRHEQILEGCTKRHLREALVGVIERKHTEWVQKYAQLAGVHFEAPGLRIPVTGREHGCADQRATSFDGIRGQCVGKRPWL